MGINIKEFLKVLSAVKPALANKEILEQSTNFIFLDENVITYNDEIMISHPFESDFAGAVHAENLYSLLSKIKEEGVEVEQVENELLFSGIKTKFKSGIVCETEIKLPISEIKIPDRMRKIPDGFLEAIKFTSVSVSQDASRPELTCIHFTSEYIESCDNFRLTRYQLKGFPVKNLSISFRLIQELRQM